MSAYTGLPLGIPPFSRTFKPAPVVDTSFMAIFTIQRDLQSSAGGYGVLAYEGVPLFCASSSNHTSPSFRASRVAFCRPSAHRHFGGSMSTVSCASPYIATGKLLDSDHSTQKLYGVFPSRLCLNPALDHLHRWPFSMPSTASQRSFHNTVRAAEAVLRSTEALPRKEKAPQASPHQQQRPQER